MWLMAVYHQVSLFSLKPFNVTSTGGRSLLIPTPFSIKMALLDVALRLYGEAEVNDTGLFLLIRGLSIAIDPPPQIVVNNCFMRIHKPRRSKESGSDDQQGSKSEGPFIRTVAFREYVQYNGPLGLAVEVKSQQDAELIAPMMMRITYFGKRGSLFQIEGPPNVVEMLPDDQTYIRLNNQNVVTLSADEYSVLQELDDCTSKLTFAKANIYSDESISPLKDRVFIPVSLPYRSKRSSRSFTFYERTP